MSAVTLCRRATRDAREKMFLAQTYSTSQGIGNRIAHINKKIDELIAVLAAERVAECQGAEA